MDNIRSAGNAQYKGITANEDWTLLCKVVSYYATEGRVLVSKIWDDAQTFSASVVASDALTGSEFEIGQICVVRRTVGGFLVWAGGQGVTGPVAPTSLVVGANPLVYQPLDAWMYDNYGVDEWSYTVRCAKSVDSWSVVSLALPVDKLHRDDDGAVGYSEFHDFLVDSTLLLAPYRSVYDAVGELTSKKLYKAGVAGATIEYDDGWGNITKIGLMAVVTAGDIAYSSKLDCPRPTCSATAIVTKNDSPVGSGTLNFVGYVANRGHWRGTLLGRSIELLAYYDANWELQWETPPWGSISFAGPDRDGDPNGDYSYNSGAQILTVSGATCHF